MSWWGGQATQSASSAAPSPAQRSTAPVVLRVPKPSSVKAPAVSNRSAASATDSTYVVSCVGPDAQEVVVKTLVGEFSECGNNHERKVYKKVIAPGDPQLDVFLYFWDGRDGPAFQGWWFGNHVGGSQVWSHNGSESRSPPASGWKIPWDGSVRPSIAVQLKAPQASIVLTAVTEVTETAQSTLAQTQELVGDYSNAEALSEAERLLVPQVGHMSEALRRLMESQRGLGTGQAKQLALHSAKVRSTQQALNAELLKIRTRRSETEKTVQDKATEERDLAAFEAILPEAEQKANAAEDAVEKALIVAEMVESAGDDMEQVKEAVAKTEQAVQQAQKALGEARIFLNAKQASSRRYESEGARTKANQELTKLQAKMQEAQAKLTPLKSARQDYLQRVAAQKVVAETLEKLTPAELEVDRADEACAILMQAIGTDADTIETAEAAINKASDLIAGVLKAIEQRKRSCTGLPRDELLKLEERGKTSQDRLNEFRQKLKEVQENQRSAKVIDEAAQKLQVVADSITKASDAEGPFLMGVEDLPLDQSVATIKECEHAIAASNTAISIARMFLATKLVEAKRFSKDASASTVVKLKSMQGELDAHIARLSELKNATSERKKKSVMLEAEAEVVKAEELVSKLKDACALFENDDKLVELTASDVRSAIEAASTAETTAGQALGEARKLVTSRQIEAKSSNAPAGASSELVKMQARLSVAQTDVGKCKRTIATVDQRIAAKKAVDEATKKLCNAEQKIESATTTVAELGECEAVTSASAEEAQKNAEVALAEALAALKATTKYVDSRTRQAGAAKDDIFKLQPRIEQAKEKLSAASGAMQERVERLQVVALLHDAKTRVEAAEQSVEAVGAAEKLIQSETASADEAKNARVGLEASITEATSAVGGAKTFLAMKRLACKRLGEAVRESTATQLAELQTRLDTVTKTLSTAKRNVAERKTEAIRQEITKAVEAAESSVQSADEITKRLGSDDAPLTPDEMKQQCEQVGNRQKEAVAAVDAAQKMLLQRQREAKSSSADLGAAHLSEVEKLISRTKQLQTSIDTQKDLLRDHEHKFVAQRLIKDGTELVEAAERALESCSEIATDIASDKPKGMVGVFFLSHLVDVLRQHAKELKIDIQGLFSEMCTNKGSLTEEDFVVFVTKVLQREENQAFCISEEKQRAAFKKLLGETSTSVDENAFVELFKLKYKVVAQVSMTDSLAVKGGKGVRKLELGEIVHGMEEAIKEESTGILRIKAHAVKDGKEGFITIAGNQGTVFLEPYTDYAACRNSFDKALQDARERSHLAQKYIQTKAEELRQVSGGPLVDTRTALLKMSPRVTKVQAANKDLEKRVVILQKQLEEMMEAERKKMQEMKEKEEASIVLDEVSEAMNKMQEAVQKVAPALEAATADKDPIKAFANAGKDVEEAEAAVERVLAFIKEKLEGTKGAVKGPLGELRTSLVKSKVSVQAIESKCKKQALVLRNSRKQIANNAHALVARALRAHAAAKDLTADALFQRLAQEKDCASLQAVRECLVECENPKFKPGELDLGLERYAGGLTKLCLSELLQDYQKCVSDIAMTSAFDVKESKTLRKLSAGEQVEVLEIGKAEQSASIHRVRCRALTDNIEGWVTVKGNQGTVFLEKCSKPYYMCEGECPMFASHEFTDNETKKLKPSEVVEVLEGPRDGQAVETQRLRGKAIKDGKVGWATVSDPSGDAYLELSASLYLCKRTIALTTTFDISEGKSIRKLEPGEALEPLEEQKDDVQRGLTRIKVKAIKDGQEGWLTVKGNQGTAYAEPRKDLYLCRRSVALEARSAVGSSALRMLESGEVFEGSDGPKKDVQPGTSRIKGRSLTDGSVGWIEVLPKVMLPWSPQYTCVAKVALHDKLEEGDARVIRELEPGDELTALEPPARDASGKVSRVRVRVEKTGEVGYASLQTKQGKMLELRSAAGSSAKTSARAPISEGTVNDAGSATRQKASAPAVSAHRKVSSSAGTSAKPTSGSGVQKDKASSGSANTSRPPVARQSSSK